MNNLVPGGIPGPGRFMTRRSRVVQIKRLVEHAKPLEPGQTKPVMVEVWEGELYRMDGISVDTLKYWDKSGACESMNGVASELDLVTVILLDPVPSSKPAELSRASSTPKTADERATEPESRPEANQEHNASAEV